MQYAYDLMDRLVQVMESNGVNTTNTYDAAGRRVQADTPKLSTFYACDAAGYIIREGRTEQGERLAGSDLEVQLPCG